MTGGIRSASVIAALALLLPATIAADDLNVRARIVVATRDLAYGETLSLADLEVIEVSAAEVTNSYVLEDSSEYIIEQRIQIPVMKGDPLLWVGMSFAPSGVLESCAGPEQGAAAQVRAAKARALNRSGAATVPP